MARENVILDKSEKFATRIVKLYKYLRDDKKEFVLSKQILRSGTSIGANVSEAVQAQSKKDFISKLSIAQKEHSETSYWLKILKESDFLTEKQFLDIFKDCEEIGKLLTSIIKTTKQNSQSTISN